MTTEQQLDAAAIARECVAQYLSTDHVLNENGEVFENVFEAVQKERGSLSGTKREAINARVRDALPDDLWHELLRVDAAAGDDVCAAERAGYLVGLEMGRRMAGGVR